MIEVKNLTKSFNYGDGRRNFIFKDLNYHGYHRFGWDNPNEKVEKVDIVGHSWFFKREWLGAYWREAALPLHYLSGEDIHFSYSIAIKILRVLKSVHIDIIYILNT